jgi:hypothetical protein
LGTEGVLEDFAEERHHKLDDGGVSVEVHGGGLHAFVCNFLLVLGDRFGAAGGGAVVGDSQCDEVLEDFAVVVGEEAEQCLVVGFAQLDAAEAEDAESQFLLSVDLGVLEQHGDIGEQLGAGGVLAVGCDASGEALLQIRKLLDLAGLEFVPYGSQFIDIGLNLSDGVTEMLDV